MSAPPRTTWTLLLAVAVAACVAAIVSGAVAWTVLESSSALPAADTHRRGRLGADVEVTLDDHVSSCDVGYEVPDDVVAVRIRATSSRGPVAVRVAVGAYDEWLQEHDDGDQEETVYLADHLDSELAGGRLVVRVESDRRPSADGPTKVVVRVDALGDPRPPEIDAGASLATETSPETGFRRTVGVRVPSGATVLRIDLADASADLDLHVSVDGPFTRVDDATESATSFESGEWLVLDAESDPPLRGGSTVWVTVTDPSLHTYAVPFRLVTTLGEDPPADLVPVPTLPLPDDPRERALLAVVEVLSEEGSGSGTLVTREGRVLTAYHVVDAAAHAVAAGHPDDAPRIVLAVSTDPHEVARDLFLAEVVASDIDLDLAMLQIVATARGADLPEGYVFPFAELSPDAPPRLGETIWTVGYPAAGGVGTRSPVTLSRGIVSGWDRAAKSRNFNTDAFVSQGSSGGAAFDERWRLVGVPISTTDGGAGGNALGNVVPVGAVPKAWWR